MGVGTLVGVGDGVEVSVGVDVGAAVGLGVAVDVSVGTGVLVTVAIGKAATVFVGIRVAVAGWVGVTTVGCGVSVGVGPKNDNDGIRPSPVSNTYIPTKPISNKRTVTAPWPSRARIRYLPKVLPTRLIIRDYLPIGPGYCPIKFTGDSKEQSLWFAPPIAILTQGSRAESAKVQKIKILVRIWC